MKFRDIFDQVVPKSDTIVVKVTAKGENDKELVSTVNVVLRICKQAINDIFII